MVVCVLLPRFELTVAAGGPGALAGRALALAPEPGREQRVGEVSGAAQALGVHAGMMLGEAIARCPGLELITADPVGAANAWEEVLAALERIGAAVESPDPGVAYFETLGLLGLHGGSDELVIAAARREIGRPARIGAGPTRFCALAAATRARARRAGIVRGDARAYLAALPVALLRAREQTAALVEPLERLGVRTLGELAALGRDAIADRFGAPGVLTHRLACGEDDPLLTRRPQQRVAETLELEESASGSQLQRALGMLVDRLLARRERRGRTLGAVTLEAALVGGGTWRRRVVFREALADPRRMRLALSPRLDQLPAPAQALTLVVERFGPPAGDQRALLEEGHELRRARLREAIAQARAAAGADAALRTLPVDPQSRVPERRVVLTPFEL
jgi:protein ImuB